MGVLEDRRDVISASWGRGMGVVIGDKFLGGGRAVANEELHLESAGYHCGIY